MRVSDKHFADLSNLWVSRTREASFEAAERVQTGRRVVRPSDDPASSAAALRESASAERADARLASARDGRSFAASAEGALDSAGAILQQLTELAIRAANDTLTPEDRAAIAREVSGLREQLVSLANTNVNGSYVFAGFADDVAPFDASGAYVGSERVREVEVAPGVRVPVGITGATAFAPAGGIDLFAATDALETALRDDDILAIRAGIDDMRGGVGQIADARARLGAFIDSFRTAESVLERSRDDSTARRSELIDAGLEEIFDYTQAQEAVETALAVASRLPLPGLIDGG